MQTETLIPGKCMEDIDSEGLIQIRGRDQVRAKNLLSETLEENEGVLVVQCPKTNNFYIRASTK